MDIKLLASILLAGRIVSVFFIVLVILRQLHLFRFRTQPDLVWFRQILFGLAIIILLGNMVPVLLDVLTVFGDLKRSSDTVNSVGVAYTLSNSFTAAVSSLLIWIMYRMAAQILVYTDSARDVALEKSDQDIKKARGKNSQTGVQ